MPVEVLSGKEIFYDKNTKANYWKFFQIDEFKDAQSVIFVITKV